MFRTALMALTLLLFGVAAQAIASDQLDFHKCSKKDEKLQIFIATEYDKCSAAKVREVEKLYKLKSVVTWDDYFKTVGTVFDCAYDLFESHLGQSCDQNSLIKMMVMRMDARADKFQKFFDVPPETTITDEQWEAAEELIRVEPLMSQWVDTSTELLRETRKRERKNVAEYIARLDREDKARAVAARVAAIAAARAVARAESRQRSSQPFTLESLSGGLLTTKPRQPQYVPPPAPPPTPRTLTCTKNYTPYSPASVTCR